MHLLLFAAIADASAIDIGGFNLRLAWLIVPFAVMLIPRSRHDRKWFWLTAALVALHLLAATASATPAKGIAYTAWIVFSYFFFFRSGVDLARRLGHRTWSVIVINGRLQIFMALLLVGFGVQERAHFTYYEPSYMAIGLVPYVFAALFISNRLKWLDGLLLMALLVANQSANLLLVLGVAFVVWVAVTGLRTRTVVGMLAVPAFAALLFAVALAQEAGANHNLAVYVRDNGMSLELLQVAVERGGNRGPRMEAALEVARAHPVLGVGPGHYTEYTANRDYSHISQGYSWLDPSGLPPVNVLLDAATTAGLLAPVLLLVTFFMLWRAAMNCADSNVRRAILGGLLALGLVMQLDANYLRGYVWLAFGLYAGLAIRPPMRNGGH